LEGYSTSFKQKPKRFVAILHSRVQTTEHEMIPAGKDVSGAVRGAAGYSRREGRGALYYYW